MPLIAIRNVVASDAQNPSSLPLPKTEGASAAPGSTSNAMGANLNNQAQVVPAVHQVLVIAALYQVLLSIPDVITY